MGMIGCIIGLNEQHNQYENKFKEASLHNHSVSADLDFISNNKTLFNNKESRVKNITEQLEKTNI